MSSDPQARAVADRQADGTRQTPDRMDGWVRGCILMGERMDRQVGMAIAWVVGWAGGLAHGRPKGQAEEA